MTEEQASKDIYKKALAAYGQAMKSFHKGDYLKAKGLLTDFIEKFDQEKELVDRALIYLDICKGRQKKQSVPLKTFEDYFQYGVYQINAGDNEEAVNILNKALKKEPKSAKVHYLLAQAYCLLEDEDKCLENLQTAIQADSYFSILAQNDNGFASLRGNEKFNTITKLA